ncbi:MAG: adenylate/guanylate cyclase domain-containing protein [Betaproteobacteria bacterium]
MNSGTSIEATFCFIDIAGYTALTETHGGSAAADLVDEFRELLRSHVEPYGKLQELIGDCAFVVFPGPAIAIEALGRLYESIADRKNFPVVRAGLHHGSVVVRGDRYFGTTVNLAARVAAQATGGHIVCTMNVAEALGQAQVPGMAITHRGLVLLRNLPQPVDLYDVVLVGSAREYAIDPVCKMQVDTTHAAGDLHYERKTYWFCSLLCAEHFARQPTLYV